MVEGFGERLFVALEAAARLFDLGVDRGLLSGQAFLGGADLAPQAFGLFHLVEHVILGLAHLVGRKVDLVAEGPILIVRLRLAHLGLQAFELLLADGDLAFQASSFLLACLERSL
ncbi:MAG: hypothetical protein R2748_12705 [Bryobacterales bacterium]